MNIAKQVKIQLFALVVLLTFGFSQDFDFVRKVAPFPMLDMNGIEYDTPLLGGLNTPIQQFVDIDGDGDLDLFVQERDGFNRISLFENTGSSHQYAFEWVTDDFEGLDTGNWFKFTDIDGDGDLDLFAENPYGRIRYFQNVGSSTEASFELTADLLEDTAGETIQLGGFSVPEWIDIDCDDELELFFGDEVSGKVVFYEFAGFDEDNIPQFEFITDCYQDLIILTGGGAPEKPGQSDSRERHGANSMTFADIDNDNDYDLIWGDFFAPSLIYLENSGTCEEPVFSITAEEFPPNNPISTGGFNVPRFADIDADNDLDMFVGVLGGAVSFTLDKAANFYYYENTGTPEVFSFQLRTKNFVRSIDVGEFSVVALPDIDGDGDYDLVLANESDIEAPSQLNSRLYLFENIGSGTSPEFQLMETHLLQHDEYLETSYAPAFIDIDGDDDLDIILGKWDGKLTLFENSGSAENVFTLVETNFDFIDVGNNSSPSFVDINGDEALDLFIGEKSGNINFYTGTGEQDTLFQLETTDFMGLDIGDLSSPSFFDVDDDNDYDMFVGSDTNGVLFYLNQGSATSPDFVLDESFEIPASRYISVQLVDIDEDGDLDLFSGVSGGGVIYYENQSALAIDEDKPVADTYYLAQNYPNPFNPSTVISVQLPFSSHINLTIYDVSGRKVQELVSGFVSSGMHEYTWDGTNDFGSPVASGVYFYRLGHASPESGVRDDGTEVQTRKMLLIR